MFFDYFVSFYNIKGTSVVLQNVLGEKVAIMNSEQEGDISRMLNWCEVCGKPFNSNGTNSSL